jgi:diaminopimelate decarboxylase
MTSMELDNPKLEELAIKQGTPLYFYDSDYLENRARNLQELCQKNSCLLRYAVKANPYPKIIKLFDRLGLSFDVSSEFEAEHLISLGIEPSKISLSSQQPPSNIKSVLSNGIQFVATSLHQLNLVTKADWSGHVAVRINPGMGSGHSNRTTTGGLAASFGIWHEYIDEILERQAKAKWRINRLHLHIGSGADPQVWQQVILTALDIAKKISTVTSLDIGGGFKVSRMPNEPEADMTQILKVFSNELKAFNNVTRRNLKIEIEPGSWLVANGGILVARIVDITDTGSKGFKFIKLNTGLNDLLRPALYGSQHPIEVLNGSSDFDNYVVVGHNCESGDILTPMPGEPEKVIARRLRSAKISDLVAIGGAGAYAASMRAINYNSFPSAKEVYI